MQNHTSRLLAALLLSSAIMDPCQGDSVIFVDDDAPAGGNGQTWATAYRYLQDALAAASASGGTITEIWVAAGTYKPDQGAGQQPGSRTATFQLINAVALRGGFAGNEDPASFDLANRSFLNNPTTLSGDLAGNDAPNYVNVNENSYHVVTGSGAGPATILDGFTVSAGNANGTSQNASGGGMYIATGGPTLKQCTFSGNSASSNGGAIYSSSSSLRLERCTFNHNSVSSGGGAVYSSSSPITLSDCHFHANSRGAIYNIFSNIVIVNSTFTLNTGTGSTAGAVFNHTSHPTITNCTFSGNSASGGGSAINNYNGSVSTLANCIVWGNGGVQILNAANITYSCVQGGWPGQGNITDDPRLLFPQGGNVRLRRGSACIDAGNNAAIPANVTQDPDGNPRMTDDPETPDTGIPGDPPQPVVDMGAYEYQSVSAERVYVRGDAAPGGDGTTWSSAYRHLQDGLAAAQTRPGVNEVWVGGGVYHPDRSALTPNGSGDRVATFGMPGGVAVYGGFPGQPGQEGNLSLRDSATYPTTLSGDLLGNDGPGFANNAENSFHIVTTSFAGPTTTLDGFIIVGGNANTSPHTSGAGILNVVGGPRIVACSVDLNSASTGAGMTNSGNLTLIDCTFSGNKATTAGGALMNSAASQATLINCTFSGNSVTSASGRGGGVYNHSDVLGTWDRCSFTGNTAFYGGGVSNDAGSNPTITNSLFSGNSADRGGGMYITTADATFANCTFRHNSGHGLYNYYSSPQLTNCVFTGNSDHGIYTNVGHPELINCTMSGNLTRAIYNNGSSSNVTLLNCILWGNGTGAQIDTYMTPTVSYSCIQRGWAGQGNIDADPLLLSVVDGDVRLHAGSPCIDAGDNNALPFEITSDVAGRPRRTDDSETPDTGAPGEIPAPLIDMGAHEYQPLPPARLFVDDDAPAPGDGGSWTSAYRYLQDALTAARTRPEVREVWVAAGLYKPDRYASFPLGTGNRSATFQLFAGLSLIGGFAGIEDPATFDLDERDVRLHATVLSGDLQGNDGPNFTNNGDNSYHVVTRAGNGLRGILDGLTISGGNANEAAPNNYGGGMHNSASTQTVIRCTFTGNWGIYGGGLFNSTASPEIIHCAFVGNNALNGGGGLFNSASSPLLANCTFNANSASFGGGVYGNSASSPTLINCTLSANTVASNGGGLHSASSGIPSLFNCIVFGNTGSQIYQGTGSVTVTHSCVQGGWPGQGNTDQDPLLVASTDDLPRLAAASPCIDAGLNSAVPAGLLTDPHGHPRFMDDPAAPDCPYAPGTCGTAPIVDMGAYEFIPPIPGDFDGNGYVDSSDRAFFTSCATRSNVPQTDPDCPQADLDEDDDVDPDDHGILQRCWSGPAPADPRCAN